MKKLLLLFLLVSSLFAKNDVSDDEELRLIYNSFLYTKDLPNAYKIAKNALKQYPNSLLWHQNMADVALWSGKSNEAMDHMVYLYQHNNDPLLVKKIIKQMLATYQYEKALPLLKHEFKKDHHHSHDDINNMVDAYDNVGRPEEAIKTLQDLHKKNPSAAYLSSILSLQMDSGDIKGATKSAKSLSSYNDKSPKTALSLSKYYFVKKDLKKSYQALIKARKTEDLHNSNYFERLSDFAWYMNDEETALYAALILYKNDRARMTDLDRIYRVYKKTDTSMLRNISQIAMKKYKKPTLFLDYINKAIEKKEFKELDRLINEVLADTDSRQMIGTNPRFWLIKATVDEHFNRIALANEDLQKALKFSSNSSTIQATILWYLIDHHQYDALAKMISDIERQKIISKELFHPLSASYLTLQKTDKSLKYFHKSFKNNPNDISLQFLYTEILASLGENEKKREVLKLILQNLKKKSAKNPKIVNDNQYIREYVQASLEFLSPKEAAIMIDSVKGRLSNKDTLELKMMMALKEENYQKAIDIYKQYPDTNPYTELELARLKHDTKSQKKLMQQLSLAAPYFLKIEFAEDVHNMSKAIAITEDAIKDNQQNKGLRDKLAGLQRDFSSKISSNVSYQKRGDLKISAIELENFYYIAYGYGVVSRIEHYHYKNENNKRLTINSENDTNIQLGLKKHIKGGQVEALVHYRDALKSDVGFTVKAEKSINQNLALSATIEKNVPLRDESDILMIGAKKDSISAHASYTLTESQRLSLMIEQMHLYALDEVKLGSGIRANLSWDYTFVKDPMIGMRLMYRLGEYKVNHKSPLLNTLLTNKSQDERLLPADYRDLGIGFFYGEQYKGYGSKWNPYLDASLFYNQKEKKALSDISAGFTGSFSKVDLYQVGLLYQNSINGQHYENYGINFNYSHLHQ